MDFFEFMASRGKSSQPPIGDGPPTGKYRPSNSDAGFWFEEKFCNRCKLEDAEKEDYCSIHNRALVFGVDEEKYPEEWCYVEGKPTCTAFQERDVEVEDPRQAKMFEV